MQNFPEKNTQDDSAICDSVESNLSNGKCLQLSLSISELIKVETDLSFCQCVDTVAQRQERTIDVGALSESGAPVRGDSGALRSSQVNQRHLGDRYVGG